MKNFKYKKRYGQNFLADQKILKKIYDSIQVNKNDLIIEVGPGNGALTKWLQKYNADILAYEIDIDLKKDLDLILNNKTKIVYQDFLKADLQKDIDLNKYENIYIIANIPYYITTQIINKIINTKLNIKSITLMVQDEVANRFCSEPGNRNYGYITVLFNYYFKIKKLFVVDRNCFKPKPKVNSAIIYLEKKHSSNIDFNKFNILIKNAFKSKRKQLKNNLKMYNLKNIEQVLNDFGYSLNNRAEDISYEIFCKITEVI